MSMQQLNLRSKELEPKKRRLEELEAKQSLKEEDMKDYQQLTQFINEFEKQWGVAENEYETFLKQQEREKLIDDSGSDKRFAQLARLRDEINTENDNRKGMIKFLTNVLTLQTTDPNDIPDEAKAIVDHAGFYQVAKLRYKIDTGNLDAMTLKLASLYDAMENIRLRIGQELTLVDGMNYKIYVLNTDIVEANHPETTAETDPKLVWNKECIGKPRQQTGDHVHGSQKRSH